MVRVAAPELVLRDCSTTPSGGGKPRFNYVTGQAPALRPRSKDVAVAAQTGWPAVVVNARVSWIPAFAGMTSRSRG